ncbi:MAG TPA: hypothetical protein VHW74_08860 [Mycobacteriales bacterium]|jgi:hypothetical protein|nr:hypothetical protein [Mycobacteriales bacterium]
MNRSSKSRRLSAAAIAGVALLSVAACGTTVRDAHAVLSQRSNEGFDGATGATGPVQVVPGGQTTAPNTGDGATNPIPTTTDLGPTTPSTTTVGTTPAQPGSTSPAGTTTTPTTGKPSPTPAVHVYKGPAKLSAVEVGIVYSGDLGAFAKLFGGSADLGNLQTYANAAISFVNSHGGLAGHVLEPVYYSIPLTSTQPYSTTMAAICSSWTQDHHVAIGVAVGFAIPNDLAACLSAHHVPYVSGGTYLHDDNSYRAIPYLVSPYEASTEDAMSALVKTLLAHHVLSSKSRVGVMLGTNESAAVDAYNDVVIPALKGKVASVTSYGIEYPPSTTAAVAEAQTVSNDELHMRANGVTNVLFLAPGVEGSFLQDAYQQHWSPKYAFTSFDAPWGLASAHTKEVLAALTGAIGIGWEPTADVGTYGSSVFSNRTTKLCTAIERPTGQVTNNLTQFAGYQYCDAMLFVQAAANASGAAHITGTSMLDGYNKLGSSYADANTFVSTLSPQQHAGASAYREFAFDTGCRCFHYSGPVTNF